LILSQWGERPALSTLIDQFAFLFVFGLVDLAADKALIEKSSAL